MPMNPDTGIENDQPETVRRRRPARRLAIGLLMLLVAVAFAAPWIIAKSAARDWLINRILATPSLSASSREASFGWFSPLAIGGVEIVGRRERFRVDVGRITSAQSWPRLLAASPHLGTIDVEKPRVRLKLPLGEAGPIGAPLSPTFSANLNDASLSVERSGVAGKLIEVDDIDLALNVHDTDAGRVLDVGPVSIYAQETLTPELCGQLLQLLSPSLADATEVEGRFSLSLDRLRVPIDSSPDDFMQRIEADGELSLHRVSMHTDNRFLQALAKLMADIHEVTPPGSTQVVKNSSVRFSVRRGRLFHEGLKLGFPDIDPQLQVVSNGSIGLDESLDLQVEVPRLDPDKMREFRPVLCHVTGTMRSPHLAVKDASLVLRVPGEDAPLLDIDGVDVNMQVEKTAAGHVLSLEPFDALKRARLTRTLAGKFLRQIDPEIQYSPQLAGEISLSIDKLRIPLHGDEGQWRTELEMHGVLAIHEATSYANTPARQTLIKLVSDLYGKEPTDTVRVTHDNRIEFELRDDRFYYSGLQFGLPDIDPSLQITAEGSIGLDETLDMRLSIPRLDSAKLRERGPVNCHVTGTIHRPEVAVQDASLVVLLPDRSEPLIDVDGVDLKVKLEQTTVGRFLSVEPVDLLRNASINRKLASSLLHLVEPELRYSPEITGEISLAVDRLRVPLDVPRHQWAEALEMRGTLTIHDASSVATTPLRLAIIRMLSDRFGKKAQKDNRIAHDTEVAFELREGRMHYSGLTIGLPDIDPALQIDSRGSLGLDQSLDLHFTLPRGGQANGRGGESFDCHVTGTVPEPDIALHDASLAIRLPGNAEPVLQVDEINLQMHLRTVNDLPVLSAEPFQVFERQRLATELNEQLLPLIAPTLDDVADVKGEVSLTIDTLRIPLAATPDDLADAVLLSGQLQLHDISATVKTPLLGAMVKVLADLYDKQPTEIVRVAKEADIRFEMREGRLFHEGMRLGFPDISPELVARSSGSVGTDRTLDLVLEVPSVLAKIGRTRNVTESDYLRYHVTGTIDTPIVEEIEAP